MIDRLLFDTTDAESILYSSNVGAYVRANDGTLITKHALNESTFASLISQGLILTSKLPGVVGNGYSFTVISTSAAAISFTEVGGAIIVDLHGNTPSTAAVAALLATSAYANVVVGAPTGTVAVAAILSFTGGTDTSVHQHLDVYSAMADGAGNPLTSTNGALNVNLSTSNIAFTASVDLDGVYALVTNVLPDSVGVIAHTRGATPGVADQNQRTTAAVPSDAVVNANVHALDTNSFNMLYNGTTWDRQLGTGGSANVNVTNTITTSDAALANIAMANATKTLAVANVSDVTVTTPLANRKYLWVYNFSNKPMYLGTTGVTAANGFPVNAGSYMELRAGAGINPRFVGLTGALPEIRTLEFS